MIRPTRREQMLGLAALGGALALAPPARAAEPKDYFGVWTGTLKTGQENPPIVQMKLVIASETSAWMYVVSQAPDAFPASRVSLTPDGLAVDFAALDEHLVGGLVDADTLRVTTTWEHAPPLELKRGDQFAPVPLAREGLGKERKSCNAPGMAAAYARNGGKATVLVDGLRSSEATVPVTSTDQWLLCSVTKSMTATLVARLVEARAIRWDMSVQEILGPSVPDMQDSYRAATFRHLLSHHAGMPKDIATADFNSFSRIALADPRAERLRYAATALKQAPVSVIGQRWEYSNNGYIVAAAMIETVCKQSWEEMITARVFRPLGLKSTGFRPPGTAGRLDQPVGHIPKPDDPTRMIPALPGKDEVTFFSPDAHAPAGYVHMNLPDLMTYLNAHLLQTRSFLRPDTWATLHTPPFARPYAMGWEVRGDVLFHAGLTSRWYAEVMIDRKARTVAAATANTSGFYVNLAVDRVLQGAALRAAQ